MSAHPFTGTLAALVTPFDAALKVDMAAFRRALDYAVDAGCTGVLVGGHTGEFSTVTPDELDDLVRAARSQVQGRAAVIQGVYAESTRQAVENGQRAKANGADGILVLPPWIFGMGGDCDREVIYQFYRAVTEEVRIPSVAFCYGPSYGFHPSVIAAIAELKHVVGVKVGGPVNHYEATLHAVGERAAVLCCADLNLFPCLAVGGDGMMAALAAYAPHWCVELFDCVRRGDGERGRQINDAIFPLAQLVFGSPYLHMPLRVKAALEALSVLKEAHARPPLLPLTPWEKANLTKTVHTSGLFGAIHTRQRAKAVGD